MRTSHMDKHLFSQSVSEKERESWREYSSVCERETERERDLEEFIDVISDISVSELVLKGFVVSVVHVFKDEAVCLRLVVSHHI